VQQLYHIIIPGAVRISMQEEELLAASAGLVSSNILSFVY
jgi:hypothetical protein